MFVGQCHGRRCFRCRKRTFPRFGGGFRSGCVPERKEDQFLEPGRPEPILALRAKPRHGLARARPDSPALRPLHSLPHSATPTPQDAFARSDGHKLPRQAGNGRALPRLKNRESGQLSLWCSPWNFILQVRLAPTRNSPPSLQNHRQWADTSAISLRARLHCSPCCPCRTPPDAPPDGRGVSINGRALPRRARTNPGHAKLNFGSAGGLSCRMLPGSRTRDVICKAAPFSVSQRVPPTNGSPPAPRATTRPPARFIEDNIVLCVPRLRH